jgi:Mg-chelatase subunit ChlD
MFLTPLFLIAAAVGASVPLFLHLMQNRRKVTMTFPTLRFLKLAEKRSSSKVRLENLLLWLLRTLIMGLIGIAFAMPMLRKSAFAWSGEAQRDVAIVIDASASMGYRKSDKTVWDDALESAAAVIEGLGEKDRVCIYLARQQPEAVVVEPIADKKEVLTRLKNLTLGSTTSQIGPALEEAVKALKKSDENREMEIHILTDNQAVPWQAKSADPASSGKSPFTDLNKLTVFVSILGVEAPDNTAPASIAIQPTRLRKGAEAKVATTFSRSGPDSETTAVFTVDGKEAGRRAIKTSTTAPETAEFRIPPLEQGLHAAKIETPDDNLSEDNAIHFILSVEKSMPVLVVGEKEDTLFVQTALRTALGAPQAVVTVTPDDLAKQSLQNHACIILCNALPLSGQAINALETYVRAGGFLVVFPGMKASPNDYKSLPFLPAFPGAMEQVPPTEAKKSLSWDKAMHPLILPLREGSASPSLSLRRSAAISKVEPGAEVLVSMNTQEPFLIEKPHGNGKVLLFTVSADRSTSDFPLSPFYLPLLVQCADYSSPQSAPYIEGTGTVILNELFPGMSEAPKITGPDGKNIPVRANAADGRTVFVAENMFLPGVYKISSGSGENSQFDLAVNIPRGESNLATITPAEIIPRLGEVNLKIATDLPTLRTQMEESRVGRTFGEQILWLVLVLAVIEFWYANSLSRRGAMGREKLELDFSGHIKKPGAA